MVLFGFLVIFLILVVLESYMFEYNDCANMIYTVKKDHNMKII